MRNATVAALIYEFLFDIYRIMDAQRNHPILLFDEDDILRQTFNHNFIGKWEWSTALLEEVGAIKKLEMPRSDSSKIETGMRIGSPHSYPLMTLDECHAADFSAFESFDNYCHAMFVLSMFDSPDFFEGKVDLNELSPRFMEDVAGKDDIFLFTFHGRLRADTNRFHEKVMGRWNQMPDGRFRRNGE